MLGEAPRDAGFRGQVAQRRLRAAQGHAVLKRPCDEKCLAVAFEPEGQPALAGDHAKTVRRVEGVDAVERGEFQARAAGVGKKLQGSGADDGVIGDLFGSLEVALDAGVLHELHIAKIGKALAADRIARGVDADLEVEAGEVANRVGIFAARQPPYRHPAGLAGMLALVGF